MLVKVEKGIYLFTMRIDKKFKPATCQFDKYRFCGPECVAFREESKTIQLMCRHPAMVLDKEELKSEE